MIFRRFLLKCIQFLSSRWYFPRDSAHSLYTHGQQDMVSCILEPSSRNGLLSVLLFHSAPSIVSQPPSQQCCSTVLSFPEAEQDVRRNLEDVYYAQAHQFVLFKELQDLVNGRKRFIVQTNGIPGILAMGAKYERREGYPLLLGCGTMSPENFL